jgi:hypothetical protein
MPSRDTQSSRAPARMPRLERQTRRCRARDGVCPVTGSPKAEHARERFGQSGDGQILN